ncbi:MULTISPECIES: hypothetical protein [unclassified Nonomuraea]|uniref:hypothetical protein n=1 Tax=unclassified Nonomuraea TaxID=2593643 RepID=UPI0033C3A43B
MLGDVGRRLLGDAEQRGLDVGGQGDGGAAADARGGTDTWGLVPRTYLRHTRDRMIPLALQDRMIREADAATPGNRFEVRTVDAGHAATAAEYRSISEILDGLAT